MRLKVAEIFKDEIAILLPTAIGVGVGSYFFKRPLLGGIAGAAFGLKRSREAARQTDKKYYAQLRNQLYADKRRRKSIK